MGFHNTHKSLLVRIVPAWFRGRKYHILYHHCEDGLFQKGVLSSKCSFIVHRLHTKYTTMNYRLPKSTQKREREIISTLYLPRFHIYRYNQPRMKNIWGKDSRKFQKSKFKLATKSSQLFTRHLHSAYNYLLVCLWILVTSRFLESFPSRYQGTNCILLIQCHYT